MRARLESRRRSQRGQVLPLTALASVVLIGAAALAVDLSVQTANRRLLQNVTDVASLAGARDLFSTSTGSITFGDQTNAVADALLTVQRQMGWPDSWLSDTRSCAGFPPAAFTTFGLLGQCEQVVYGNYTVTVSTPPLSPRSQSDMDPHDLQVDMTQTSQNGLGGVIGFTSSQQGGHAIASHMAGGSSIDFALFSNTYVQGGNQNEIVYGNVYANRAVQPQSSGSATFCAGSTGPGDGYIILASPQTLASGGQPSVTHARTIASSTSCSVAPASSPVFQVGAGMQNSPPSCPTIPGVPGTLAYDSSVGACVTLPITPPTAVAPPLAGNVVPINTPCRGSGGGGGGHRITGCWGSSTLVPAGLYVISHTSGCDPPSCYDLLISSTMTLANVTFWLKPNAAMSVNMGGSGGTVTDTGPYNDGTGQAGDGRYVVYGEGNSKFYVVGANNTVTFTTGSIYMPAGSVVGQASTAALFLDGGQAVVDTWQISTGAQPNPQITGNPAFDAVSQETLRLVE